MEGNGTENDIIKNIGYKYYPWLESYALWFPSAQAGALAIYLCTWSITIEILRSMAFILSSWPKLSR